MQKLWAIHLGDHMKTGIEPPCNHIICFEINVMVEYHHLFDYLACKSGHGRCPKSHEYPFPGGTGNEGHWTYILIAKKAVNEMVGGMNNCPGVDTLVALKEVPKGVHNVTPPLLCKAGYISMLVRCTTW